MLKARWTRARHCYHIMVYLSSFLTAAAMDVKKSRLELSDEILDLASETVQLIYCKLPNRDRLWIYLQARTFYHCRM
jgi:hypothetical protein